MHPSSSLSSIIDDAPIPMEQRRWVLVLGVLRVDDACYAMTKNMTNCHVTTQNFEKKTALSHGIILFLQIQRSSAKTSVNGRCVNGSVHASSYGWIDYMYHVGSSFDCRSIARAGLLAGGTSGIRGQTCFLTAVDPMNELRNIPSHEVDEPRMVLSKTNWRRHQGTVYWFDRSAARTKSGIGVLGRRSPMPSYSTTRCQRIDG